MVPEKIALQLANARLSLFQRQLQIFRLWLSNVSLSLFPPSSLFSLGFETVMHMLQVYFVSKKFNDLIIIGFNCKETEVEFFGFWGGITHQDCVGHKCTIGPSDVQWMTTGRGIIHPKMPTRRETQRDYSFGSIYPPKTKCQNSSFC
ncbi:hypothetical protein ACB098_04G101200 [Castanea mollissima]